MSLKVLITAQGFRLDDVQERHIRHQLSSLERRLAHRSEPVAHLVLTHQPQQRLYRANLRVHLGPDGPTLVSRQAAQEADHAARMAVEAVERELERRQANQQGAASFGVPSRREFEPSKR